MASESGSSGSQPTQFSRGTTSYRAPELFGETPKYSKKVDIWALGCITFELLTGTKAFPSDWSVIEYLKERTTNPSLRIHPSLNENLNAFPSTVNRMLSRVPDERPTIEAQLEAWSEAKRDFEGLNLLEGTLVDVSNELRGMKIDIENMKAGG